MAAEQKALTPLPRRTVELRFKGAEYDGVVVEAYLDVPMQVWYDLQGASAEEELRLFGDHVLVSWTLPHPDDPTKPLPATGEGMMAIWPTFKDLLFSEWMTAVATPPAPLSEPSSNGATLDETSLPMEALATESPGSFSEPR